ncbi:thiol-disulfide oxidoreductase DCC family protein [Ammoniphilus sp. CFH 90114]|uniref:thiol-disulfide oxidoreductase DCC family protein n=1 Tax=Ammoniphilus sp. CFH 90114 TaxID=2493665 RepID=UPI00100FE57D|nr:thiol-disulfide oxidoreductase DCC family protein [Ammoniphilus sp. CFH 90114]RXT06433.1 thiol-disulfide oxidoreductase DCC family protein [Ammoniphilus sp. CFH 90114]
MSERYNAIILFDGVCNFCNFWVNQLIALDYKGVFKFASLQSHVGESLIKHYNLSENLDSVILIHKNRSYKTSTAILNILRLLGGSWRLLYFLIIVPSPLRDGVYKWVAKNRYSFFGKSDTCVLPTPEIRRRFIEDINKLKELGINIDT